jgi:hypothetical protein
VQLENLLVHDGRVVVGDFGLVKGPDDSDLTSPEKPVGPIRNLAPELAAGDPSPDLERIDVYYLAHALSRLASGREARGHIRSHEADSLALRLPEEPEITQLARLIDDATARDPAQRPTLRAFEARLTEWIAARERAVEIRSEHERYASLYVARENRNRAVLHWLVTHVRSEPVFGACTYVVADPDDPSPEIAGLTQGQMAQALLDLIDDGLISGEPQHAMGRSQPRHFTHLYPTVAGVEEIHNVDALLLLAAPLLRALEDPLDVLTLPRATEPTEIAPGIVLTPPRRTSRCGSSRSSAASNTDRWPRREVTRRSCGSGRRHPEDTGCTNLAPRRSSGRRNSRPPESPPFALRRGSSPAKRRSMRPAARSPTGATLEMTVRAWHARPRFTWSTRTGVRRSCWPFPTSGGRAFSSTYSYRSTIQLSPPVSYGTTERASAAS